MTLLNDKQIARLAEKDIFLPYVGEKRRTLDNGTKAISYGLCFQERRSAKPRHTILGCPVRL